MLVSGAILFVLFAEVRGMEEKIASRSCKLSCDRNEDESYDLTGARVEIYGLPEKREAVGPKGAPGVKGDRGVKGDIGPQGNVGVKGDHGENCESQVKADNGGNGNIRVKGQKGEPGVGGRHGVQGRPGRDGMPGHPCDCSRNDELVTQFARLQAQLNNITDQIRQSPGWWRGSNGHWYKYFVYDKVDYITAKIRCEAFGARLGATGLRNAEFRREIKRLRPAPMPNFWIGLDDLASQGNYVWSDGVLSTRDNTDWDTNEPNTITQRCVMMAGWRGGLMHDVSCTDKYYFLCEA